MRLIVTLTVILSMIIGLGFWFNYSLETSSDELTQQIDLISAEIREGHWEKAVEHNKKLETTWGEKAKWWPIFLDHQEMDNIEFSLAKVKEYVASQNLSLALGQLSELKLMIEHIPEKEIVNLKNIL